MQTTAHIRRRWRIYLYIGLPILLMGVALYTGFAADVGTAILVRLPKSIWYGHSSQDPLYAGPSLLEERVVGADVIARVEFQSASQIVEFHDYSVGETAYAVALEFKFKALEYLKGSGGVEIEAVAHDLDAPYNTRLGAATLGENLLSGRDTRWDDREAIIFLSDNHPSLPSSKETDRYWFGFVRFNDQEQYSIRSDNKLWLPAALPPDSGSDVASGSADQSFLLDDPDRPAPHPKSYAARLMAEQKNTITLSELKTKIQELEKEVEAGDGSMEYRRCVYLKYEWERRVRYWIAREGEYFYTRHDHVQESGMPAGSWLFMHRFAHFYVERFGATLPNEYDGKFWLEGRDKDMFTVEYPGLVSMARPLPKGEYRFFFNTVSGKYIICDAKPKEEREREEHFVNVTAPREALHEAFFDPVVNTSTSAVGADGSLGALKPTDFRVTGYSGFRRVTSTTTVKGLYWENNKVRMEFAGSAPRTELSGSFMDVIGLDGKVSLTLDFSKSSLSSDGKSLSWDASKQPWKAGDKLMLRIREGMAGIGGESSGASGSSGN